MTDTTPVKPNLNRAIVAHLRKTGPCSALALMDLFCEGESEDARRSFRKRLNYLADAGALVRILGSESKFAGPVARPQGAPHGGAAKLASDPNIRLFDAGPPGAYIPGVDKRRVRGHVATRAKPAGYQPPAPNVAPPRQVQVMFGPVYVPPRGPALRAGALDHQACASRGHRC